MLRTVVWALMASVSLTLGSWQVLAADDHDHPHEGPHHGDLIELGDEEYHAELVHNEKTETITIYLLGPDAKTAVATDAKELAINAKVKGKGVQMKVKAQSQKGDQPGTASRFVSRSPELVQLLEDHKVQPMLRVSIKGKSYQGKITHRHDHDHDHK